MMLAQDSSPFVWSDGVRVAGTSLWCDATRARELCFISHAAVPLAKGFGGGKLLATHQTVRFREALGMPLATEVLTTPYCRPFAIGRARLQLLPSGLLPGSAQLHVELRQRSVLYAGAIGASTGLESRNVEPLQVRAAECVVFDAPLAPYLSALPPRKEVEEDLLSTLETSLSRGQTALLSVPLIESDAVTKLMVRARMSVRLHPQIAAHLSACDRLGLPHSQPRPPVLRGVPRGGDVVVWPLEKAISKGVTQWLRVDRFLISGQALESNAARRFGVERAFARSHYADLPAILSHALAAGARLVYLTRGFTEAVARAFAERGIAAEPLGPPAQMPLFRAVGRSNGL